MSDTTSSKPYESVRIRAQDKPRVEAIASSTGLPEIDSVGVALEAWGRVPKRARERIVLDRMRRKSLAA